MSDQPAQVTTAADATIAGNTTPSAPVAAPTTPAVAAPAPAPDAKAPEPQYPQLPPYALQYAPILWLHNEEKYWPGNPLEHLLHTAPQNKDGTKVDVPHDVFGKFQCLKLPGVNHPDVYLCLDKDDPRVDARIEALMSTRGKPHPDTHKSESACWIIAVDKTKEVGEGTLDVFYFYFYPYNLGNTVAFTAFGNHVGDWEHAMVRFKNGQPIGVHLSAHADGHSWAWKTMEKMGDRPVGYVATGSHAMYGKPGSKHYSPVPVVGPVDYAQKGVLWDPVLNYVAVKYDVATQTFSPMGPPQPTPTLTAPAAQPGASGTITPEYNTQLTTDEILAVLEYKGRWGNSFSDIKEAGESTVEKVSGMFHKLTGRKHTDDSSSDEDKKAAKKHGAPGLRQRLSMLRWAEGPTGPRYKSLERVGCTWNTTDLLPELV